MKSHSITHSIAFLLTAIVAALSTSWAANESDAAKRDLAQLQGEWLMSASVADGNMLPEAMLKTAKRVCTGNETTVTIGAQLILKAEFTLDPSKTPKAIDYMVIDGPTKGQKHFGIYELAGGTVKFCFAKPDAARPTEFASKSGDGQTLSTWRRAAPGTSPVEKKVP